MPKRNQGLFSKNIDDICLMSDQVCAVRRLPLTALSVEELVGSFTYSGKNLESDPSVENAKLPPAIVAFYYFLFKKLSVPTEEEFINAYSEVHEIDLTNGPVIYREKNYPAAAVRARLLRTYPSILRDFHFYLLLKESGRFQAVRYSLATDYHKGIDISVVCGDGEFGLSILLNTKRGRYFKKRKTYRHDYGRVKEIVLEVDFNSLHKCGDFFLLCEHHIDSVIKLIDDARS